jgi:nesprin-1
MAFCSSLSLQASRGCQSKEKLLDQGFRSAFREFQQWLVNAKINTAKCFDVPQNLSEASSSLQKIQVNGNIPDSMKKNCAMCVDLSVD